MIAALPSIVSRLRLKQLRLLIALDEQGSVHRAAEQVFISQPGATKSLHEIENTFGAELFTRNSQGLVPNDLGRCVIRYARLIHSDVAHLREEMVGILQGHGGRLSVGTIMGAVPMLMRALGRLRRKQPELSVEIVEDTSARLLGLVDQGRLDLAICRSSVSQRPDAYDCLTLHPEQLTVVAHPDHPARAATLELADLSIYRWVVYPAARTRVQSMWTGIPALPGRNRLDLHHAQPLAGGSRTGGRHAIGRGRIQREVRHDPPFAIESAVTQRALWRDSPPRQHAVSSGAAAVGRTADRAAVGLIGSPLE